MLYGSSILATAALLSPSPIPSLQADWQSTFEGWPGIGGIVLDAEIYDDGTGPAIYVSGDFESASGLAVSNIARWNGAAWEAVGEGIVTGLDQPVRTLEVFDPQDGSGPGLYVGGWFGLAGGVPAQNVARFDSTGWSMAGAGLSGPVEVLRSYDDGSGPSLYAGGSFDVDGSESRGIARLAGSQWLAPPIEFSGTVRQLEPFESPDGMRLILGGQFFAAEGLSQAKLAIWDGALWSDVGEVPDLAFTPTIEVFDDGRGDRLFVAGAGFPLQSWDGAGWAVEYDQGGLSVSNLEVHSSGDVEDLYCLVLDSSNGDAQPGKWTGTSIQLFEGSSWGTENVLLSLNGLGQDALCIGGDFGQVQIGADILAAKSVAKWSPTGGWSAFGAAPLGLNVSAQTLFDDGSGHGPELYVAGGIPTPTNASSILRWRDQSWEPFVEGFAGVVEAFEVFDVDGDGSDELIAAGSFQDIDSVPAAHLAVYEEGTWKELGGGANKPVHSLLIFEDEADFPEPTLFVGGEFNELGGQLHKRVGYWTGSEWGHLGGNGNWNNESSVNAMASYDRGSGAELYVTGAFSFADGNSVGNLARWSGEAWRPVGTQANYGLKFGVGYDLQAFDDGQGELLYVAGSFSSIGAGFLHTPRIARTNGFVWFDVDGGFQNLVRDLEVYDDPVLGPLLIACGAFIILELPSGGVPANGIAAWNGESWSAIGGEIGDSLKCMLSLEPGALPIDGLLVGGSFKHSPGGDAELARWGSPLAGLTEVPGCSSGAPPLQAGVGSLVPGGGFDIHVTSVTSPLAAIQLYVGTGQGPCGLEVPGLGELLIEIAPFPALLASGSAIGGHGTATVFIPEDPSLGGQTATLQALLVDLSGAGPALELTQGLIGSL